MSQNPKPLNVVELKDDKVSFTIYYEDTGKFVVHTKDYEELNETLTEYSFESFAKMTRLMDVMLKELCLTNSDARSKLFKMNKPELKSKKI